MGKRTVFSIVLAACLIGLMAWPVLAQERAERIEVPPDVQAYLKGLPTRAVSPDWVKQAAKRMVHKLSKARPEPQAPNQWARPARSSAPPHRYPSDKWDSFGQFVLANVWPSWLALLKEPVPKAIPTEILATMTQLLEAQHFPTSECSGWTSPQNTAAPYPNLTTFGVATYADSEGFVAAITNAGGPLQYIDAYAMFALDLTAWLSGRVYAGITFVPSFSTTVYANGPDDDEYNNELYYGKVDLIGYAEKGDESSCQLQPIALQPLPSQPGGLGSTNVTWEAPYFTLCWPIAEPFHVQAGEQFQLLVGFRVQASNPLGAGRAYVDTRGYVPEILVRIAPDE